MSKGARPKGRVTIREMRPEDLEGVLEIERATKGDKRAVTYAPVPDSCIGGEVDSSVVAEAQDKIVGFVLGRVVNSPTQLRNVAWIELIGIHPDYQSQGIGKKMLEAWKERCRKKGIRKVSMAGIMPAQEKLADTPASMDPETTAPITSFSLKAWEAG